MSNPQRILLTGSAGLIGSSLRRHLGDEFSFRCLDIRPTLDEKDTVVVDIAQFDQVLAALQGISVVIHLAAIPDDAPWEILRENNIVGTYNVFEAARQVGATKIIFASTNHVTGYYELEGESASPDVMVRPDSMYGVSKAFGEALGRFYSDRYGMSVICFRIGSFLNDDDPLTKGPRCLGTWCSHRDFAQLVRLALMNDRIPFGIFYGVSGNDRRPWDISNAQELLGYDPLDNAEKLRKESQ